MVIALVILVFFLLTGDAILSFLEIEQSSLNIAGGVILFIIAIGLIFPRRKWEPESPSEEPFIVPMAMPLVAGPSAIAYLLLLSKKQENALGATMLALLVAWLGATLILSMSPYLIRWIGAKGAVALERLMGMVLAVISVPMLLNAVHDFVASLPTSSG